ncbi:SGNH/GDSL hydrolase family protein [Fictibacillus barbaricus]|uniref:Lysophospholipase L1-like esterase n=1 Tax=Fictibacillus barbaricus TaxID=182136 RepID=A0ABU1U1P5_9BACL|nr:GDSL-type esterase/lipase family protein [Fictibacillus barbaricus]MDR7073391.1 lysophospholipase L1-like esterase [Fictibacillus barbaricus]
MKLGKKPLSLLLSLLLLSLFFSPLKAAAAPEENHITYVALGDSLAAGVTPSNTLGLGYPHYLAGMLQQSNYTVTPGFFGVPGYTSTDVLNDLTVPARPLYYQLQNAIKQADIITIDIGANDILKKLTSGQQIKNTDIQQTVSNLTAILVNIKKTNPSAKVYVMGYYNPFPHPNSVYAPYVPTLMSTLNKYSLMSQGISKLLNATFVPTASLIQSNYGAYLTNPNNIHLSPAGYQAIAAEFFKAIQSNKALKSAVN